MVKYCIYCGLDKNKGHHKDCPIISGIPESFAGIRSKQNDIEFNLYLGRLSQQFTINEDISLGTGNKIRDKRLAYEEIAFLVRRIMYAQIEAQKNSKKRFWGIFARRKLKKINKQVEETNEYAKLRKFSKKEIKSFWNQKILLANYSGKEHIPLFRDSKTDELIYFPVE